MQTAPPTRGGTCLIVVLAAAVLVAVQAHAQGEYESQRAHQAHVRACALCMLHALRRRWGRYH